MGRVFTEADRVQVRNYLGFSALFLQADPSLETALTTIQSVTDGGTRPDDSSVVYVLDTIVPKLQQIDDAVTNLIIQAQVTVTDETSLDVARGQAMLWQQGRMWVSRLSQILSTYPRRDCFTSSKPHPHGTAFPDISAGERAGNFRVP